jgi:hypothetical protein
MARELYGLMHHSFVALLLHGDGLAAQVGTQVVFADGVLGLAALERRGPMAGSTPADCGTMAAGMTWLGKS